MVMSVERLELPPSEYVERDLLNIQVMIEQLKQRFVDNPEGLGSYKGIIIQPFQASCFAIAKQEAMPVCGFEAVTTYGVGGDGEHTMLWANSGVSERHWDKVSTLGIAVWEHPLYKRPTIPGTATQSLFNLRTGPQDKRLWALS